MKQVLQFIDDKFEEIIGTIMLATVVTLIFLGVVMRVGFNRGIPWQEELSRVFYVLVVYLGASYGIKTEDHIRVTVVSELLPPRGKKALEIITDIIWVLFNIAIVVISLSVYPRLQRFMGRSAVLEIPLHYIFLTVPIGSALMTLRLIQNYYQKYRRKAVGPTVGG